MYDPDKHFVERIEIAIQRFKQKRKMHEAYANVFNKWMRFGGVESAPRMFGGLSQKDMTGMDAEEIARARAVHQVPWDREDTKKWVVDFTGVGKAFLCVGTHWDCTGIGSARMMLTELQVFFLPISLRFQPSADQERLSGPPLLLQLPYIPLRMPRVPHRPRLRPQTLRHRRVRAFQGLQRGSCPPRRLQHQRQHHLRRLQSWHVHR